MPHISLEMSHLSPDECRVFETRLNLHAERCGCGVGAVAGALGLVGCSVYLLLAVGMPAAWQTVQLVWSAAFCLSTAVVGKLIGLLHARAATIAELERLNERLHGLAT